MFEVRDYIVMEGTNVLGQPIVELWLEYLPGVDGLQPQHTLEALQDNSVLHVPELSRSIMNLSSDAWSLIDLTQGGVVVVCGPSGVMWRAEWTI